MIELIFIKTQIDKAMLNDNIIHFNKLLHHL